MTIIAKQRPDNVLAGIRLPEGYTADLVYEIHDHSYTLRVRGKRKAWAKRISADTLSVLDLRKALITLIGRAIREIEGDDTVEEIVAVYAKPVEYEPKKVERTKPSLREWAMRWRGKGKFRWLEVNLTDTDGGGYGVVTIQLWDRSYPGAKKYKWFEPVIHSSLAKECWRKTVATAIKKMRKQSQEGLQAWLDEN